ncbi:MAG: serine hydrolase domain-containing protein [Granulosicoccus sp.]
MENLTKRERASLDEIIKSNKAVGASTATISEGKLVNQEVFGLMNSRAGLSVETTTKFQAASISKTVNAVAILTLVNRGLVALEDPVNIYLKKWQLQGEYAESVTIKHLLSHSGGTTVHGFRGYGSNDPLPSTIEILSGNEKANSPIVTARSAPGKAYKYSGGGTTILQAIVEELTNSSYEKYISEKIFKPLGMIHSCYLAPNDFEGFSCAHGAGGNPIRGNYRRHPEKAAAGLWTTPKDIASLLIGLFNSFHGSDKSLLPRSLTELMISKVVTDSGLGVFLVRKNLISHSGANYGFRSFFVFHMESGNGAVAMSNSERGARTPAQLMAAIGKQRNWK